ncbi:MAG: hypothetical protein ACRDPB_08435 [Nocardioidaceae bacterium]
MSASHPVSHRRSSHLGIAVVVAAVVCAVLAGGVWVLGRTRPVDGPGARSAPGSATSQVPDLTTRPAAATEMSMGLGVAAEVPAVRILHRWDRRRSRAYADGSVAELRRLYVDGSAAGRADVRLLRTYADRGLRVQGMRMQLLSVSVLAHREGLLRLRVTDRLTGAVAVGPGLVDPGHRRRLRLPRDGASSHVLTLRPADDGWRVAAVEPSAA